jgi:hypothetical protein
MRSHPMIVIALVTCALRPLPTQAQPAPPSALQLRKFLEVLQDMAARENSPPPPAPLRRGLVPISESNTTYTNIFINAVDAIAFNHAGAPVRARFILDVLARQNDVCPGCACQGGLQKERLITGESNPSAERNDFFVGENAWVLTAARDYQRRVGDHRYDALIERIENWFVCLDQLTPEPGLPAGYDKNGNLLLSHAEGSIDVYGSLNGSTREDVKRVQASVKTWLDENVWVPNGSCFERGPDNQANLPLDHVAWGVLALPSEYRCLLRHAEALNYRCTDRYTIEMFDREPLQYWNAPATGVSVTVRAEAHGEGHDLAVDYQVTDPDHDFLLMERDRDIDFEATPGFVFAFWLKGDGQGRSFDVKLRNKGTSEVYWKPFSVDFEGWKRIEVPYEQFSLFSPGPGAVLPLGRVDKIQFGLNTNHQTVAGSYSLGRIEYANHAKPFRYPVGGFSSFQSERNWLFLEGTAATAIAYCSSGDAASWRRHVNTLGGLTRRAEADPTAWGLPSWFTGGAERPEPNALGTAWLLMAMNCVDPF